MHLDNTQLATLFAIIKEMRSAAQNSDGNTVANLCDAAECILSEMPVVSLNYGDAAAEPPKTKGLAIDIDG